ncbi:hypothetical protein [Vibrio scophthalmi]|uniref:hypothetical protein n=1 Tax=Vibrio scophthalmi TaxID=45658 RepID=UPI0002E1CE72|nr:hypothetical protein [Vibrio scophthalmi]
MNVKWKGCFSLSKNILLMVYIPVVSLLIFSVIMSVKMGIPFEVLSKDPLSFSGANPLTGVLSNIGIIIWSGAASVCLMTALLLNKYGYPSNRGLSLFFAGMISLVLLLDDCFMLHEVIYPQWLGIPESIIMMTYALMLLAYLYLFREKILSADISLLLVFFVMFGLSAIVDFVLPSTLLSWHFVIEDGAKFIGIVSWFSYHTLICFTEIKLSILK